MKSEMSAKIIKDLESNEEGRYTITPQDFSEIEDALCKSRSRFTYNACDGSFQFMKLTFIHGSSRHWLRDWVDTMNHHEMVKQSSLSVHSNVDLQTFQGPFTGSKKNPNAIILPSMRKWPTIALELGYKESKLGLITGILEGSKGRIGYVIMVQIEQLAAGDQGIQEGYVELYKYNQYSGKKEQIGKRQCLYPVPSDHSGQCIEFSWNDILRNKSDICTTKERPPPLYLDDLRSILEDGVKMHLANERDEDDIAEMTW